MSSTEERASKKQRELLSFVDSFIKGNGYGPSYREIMRALGYKSVSTVAIHIDNLIKKGYLIKKTHSARSLEVVTTDITVNTRPTSPQQVEHQAWLKSEAERLLDAWPDSDRADIEVLVEALRVVGDLPAHRELIGRLSELENKPAAS